MTEWLTRAQLAEELKVSPMALYRWEKANKSPVKPKRLLRNRQLRYPRDSIEKLREWMNKVTDE